jgi:hypothetical protein
MKTIQIETSQKSSFEKRFTLFAKKVAKMGLEKPTFLYGETYNKEKDITTKYEGEVFYKTIMLEVVDVNLNIDNSYKMNGWELVSVVLFKDCVILPIDLNTIPPTELGLEYIKCDHCGGNHKGRKKSFIVKNEAGFKQVGSTCSKEFLGMSESNITNMQVMFAELVEIRFTDGSEDEDAYCGRMGRDKSWLDKYSALELSKAMSVIIPEVSENGYEKQKFAQVPVLDWRGNQSYNHNGQLEYKDDRNNQINKESATINKITPKIEEGVEVDFSEFSNYVNGLKIKTHKFEEHKMENVYLSQDNFIEDFKKALADGKFESVSYGEGFDETLSDVSVPFSHRILEDGTREDYNFQTYQISGFNCNGVNITLISTLKNDRNRTGYSVNATIKSWIEEKEVVVEDFNSKLQQLVNQKIVMKKDLSTLCAGYASFLKFKSAPITNFIGIVGEKEKMELTITDIKTGNGTYGEWTLYSMKDEDGNFYTKFGTINTKFSNSNEVKVGSIISALFEIKEHKEFNMIKQTALGRLSTIK